MSVVLKVHEGNTTRDVAVLPSGRLLQIGREGEHNDVSFPHDRQMSARHATLLLQEQQCILSDLGSTNGTWVNNTPIQSAEVGDGSAFRCGTTEFVLEWLLPPGESGPPVGIPTVRAMHPALVSRTPDAESDPLQETVVADEPPEKRAAPPELDEEFDLHLTSGFCRPLASQIIDRFQLSQDISLTPEDGDTPQEFIDRLMTIKDGAEVIHFLAFALPRRRAVMWLVQCVRSDIKLTDQEAEVLDLVEAWVNDPSESNRVAPLEFVAANKIEGLTTWPAQAAFYSHGSTTPSNCPKVPPKDELAGKTALAGITLAIVDGEAEDISDRRNACIQRALAGNS